MPSNAGVENYQAARAACDAQLDWVDSLPMVIYIESIKNCPLECAMCDVPTAKVQHISQELLEKIEPYFPYFGHIAIHGEGEPLLTDKLDYFVGLSERYGCSLHMDTTGLFLSDRTIESLARAHLSMTFSIHAGTQSTYRKIMGQDLSAVSSRIGKLVSATRNPELRRTFKTSFLVLRDNIDEIPEFLDLTAAMGIGAVRFMKLRSNPIIATSSTDAVRDDYSFRFGQQLNQEIVDLFYERLPDYQAQAERLGIDIKRGSFPERSTNAMQAPGFAGCVAPWTGELQLKQNGEIKLCCGSETNDMLGNLNEQSLETIWNSRGLRKIRRELRKNRVPAYCRNCKGFDWSAYQELLEGTFYPGPAAEGVVAPD